MPKIEWKCPKCGALCDKCGKGPCIHGPEKCDGFLCNCDDFGTYTDTEDHGESFSNVCRNAVCNHCGWCGTFPQRPNGILPWEKKALDAGWIPPESRAVEWGLAEKVKQKVKL
jgi:hypothetical protein